jgi:hypothetical protein
VKRVSAGKDIELIVKVDLGRATDPVAHVRDVLAGVTDGPPASVKEVFPGLRSGASAGLLSVRLECERGSKAHRSSEKALRSDEAVVYVEEPKPRKPL